MSSAGAGTGEQLSLVRASTRRPRSAVPAPDLAAVDPVAVVAVDVGLAHLDRPFEYSVPEELAGTAVPGARVKVRFAGQDVDGFVLERRAEAEHEGRLAPLRRGVRAAAGPTPPPLAPRPAGAAPHPGPPRGGPPPAAPAPP